MPILVCALSCEAKPLIDHFRLRLISNELPFSIYERENLKLIVTGVGEINASTACGYLGGKYSVEDDSWLNIGICGAKKKVGTPFLANKIFCEEKSFYPSFVFPLPCSTLPLLTTSTPQKSLREGLLFDMEGVGFFAAASKFSKIEGIHCLKIVSDCGAIRLDKNVVMKLIEDQIPLLENLLANLANLKLEKVCFDDESLSATERHKIRRLLQKCKALGLSPPSLDPNLLQKFIASHVPTHLH